MNEKVTMYSWPESQMCMECKNGEFIMSDKFDNSDYLCMVACDENDGIVCPKYEDMEKDELEA